MSPAPETSASVPTRAPGSAAKARAAQARVTLPVWLRSAPRGARTRKSPPTPRQARWWVGVVWLLISALLLGFVAHVTLVGALQHSRSQYILYQQLRSDLALATAPLGQLDVNRTLVQNGTPIGVLTIERLGITEVIVQGTRPEDLTSAPGHRRDTVFPGQSGTSIVMGRQASYGGPFGALAGLIPGDRIEIVTGQGTSKYEVFGVRREGDMLPETLKAGAGRLELVTADGIPLAPSGALYIDASLTSEVKQTPSRVFTKEVLSPSEFAMAADTSGWFPMFFWLQLLTVAAIALRWVRSRWGRWQTWAISLPVLLALGAATANAAMTNLPNLL